MKYLYCILIIGFTSCGFAEEFGGGTLGAGGGVIEVDCEQKELELHLNEFCKKDKEMAVPDEYVKHTIYHDTNYDFLKSWTLYFPDNDIMIWLTLVEREDKKGRISIRSVFNVETETRESPNDFSEIEKKEINKLITDKVLNHISCNVIW